MNRIENSMLAVTRTTDLAPSYVTPSDPDGLFWVWVAVACFVAIAIGIAFWFMTQNRTSALSVSDDVTLELCRAHRVGLQHRFALETVAGRAKLAHTAEMFLSPQLFDEAIVEAGRTKRLGIRQRGLLYEARNCIFG